MKYRLRQLVRLVGAVLIPVAVAAAASAATLYVTGPSGLVICVPEAAPAIPSPIPRSVIVAGIPTLVAALAGAFFALAAERILVRLIGLALTAALAAATFYAVYTLLPAACRP
jgi:hypothetical protein